MQQYYDGHVEEVDFNTISDVLRRRTNLLVKRQTLGRVVEYLRGSGLSLTPPFAAFSANVFQVKRPCISMIDFVSNGENDFRTATKTNIIQYSNVVGLYNTSDEKNHSIFEMCKTKKKI